MHKVDWWNVAFSLFFVFLMLAGFAIVATHGPLPQSIAFGDALLLALASFRLTRLVVYDSITQWFRDLVAHAPPRTFVGTIHTLVNCPWCTGFWFALILTVVYFAWPQLWFFIFVTAIAAVGSMFQILANLIGWHAEFKKRATLRDDDRDIGDKCG